jgi:phospholipase C
VQRILPQIEHVVVLMMENRSLDNLLGFLYTDQHNQPPHNLPAQSPPTYEGLVAQTSSNQLTASAAPVYATEGTSSTEVPNPEPGETFAQITAQIFGTSPTANMSGFLANYATITNEQANQIMTSYSPTQVPVLSQLATAFALCDHWFASAPCQTWPNRGFVHTGSSDGHINNDDAEPYDIPTIFNLLDAQGVSWMVYNDSIVPAMVHLMFPQLWPSVDHFASMAPFYAACQQPATAPARAKLPQYTFLEPNFLAPNASYHPPHDIRPAEQFVAQVYGALQACPYRDAILFVLTFDEHGGCYDHVAPPSGAAAPEPGPVSRDGRFNFSRYGVRVPTLVVSSYVQPGTVFRAAGPTPYDHTSILATVRDWLGIQPSAFSALLPSPRIAAAPTLAAVLTEATPQAWPVITAPPPPPPVADLSGPIDEFVMNLVIGETSRRAGRYIGAVGVAVLRQTIRTLADVQKFFTAQPFKIL